jgi:hypothetical protein
MVFIMQVQGTKNLGMSKISFGKGMAYLFEQYMFVHQTIIPTHVMFSPIIKNVIFYF